MKSLHFDWRALAPAVLIFALSGALTYGVVHLLRAHLGVESPAPAAAEVAAFGPLATGVQLLPDMSAPTSIIPEFRAAPEPTLNVVSGRISRGSTVGTALGGQGVSGTAIHAVARALRPVFDFRRARAGDFFTLIRDEDDEVLSFEYQRGREKVFRVHRDPSGALVASGEDVPLERRVVQLAGIIEDSVFAAVTELGEGPDLVHAFADVFVWDVDFSKQVRPGDQFRLLVEKFYDGKGFVRYGRVLAAEYRTAQRTHTVVYYEDTAGYGDYFTPDGRSVKRSFLRAPLKFQRISSRFTNLRMHPVLKIGRPHWGVDYAAPTGTPVWSVAGGEVIFAGWQGGFGRIVKIRHQNGYITYYGHLSRYASGLRVGQRVQQKQVIGYVGASGLATGPHLDYRVQVNGRFLDPLKLAIPTGEPIPREERQRFADLRDLRIAELQDAQPAVILDAAR